MALNGRRWIFAGVSLLATGLVCLLATELAGRFYAYRIAEQGRLFESDAELGWRVLPHLDLFRRNANGDRWHIVTDGDGSRTPRAFRPGAPRRVLVLGDSFAFGEGVDVDARFDRRIEARHPQLSLVNLGVMGYGTDQQLLAARPLVGQLRAGDVLLLLTASNDLPDLLRHSHSGRAKPWVEQRDGGLVFHPPAVTWLRVLRDRSYLLAAVMARVESDRRRFSRPELLEAASLYRSLVEAETGPLVKRGVEVVIAHHVIRFAPRDDVGAALALAVDSACTAPGTRCLALDAKLRNPAAFLRDRHWTPRGHAIVAEAIGPVLEAIAGDRRP